MMIVKDKKRSPWFRRILIGALILLVIGAGIYWFVATEKFTDTTKRKAVYSVNANDFIREFTTSINNANQKYTDKIVTVTGIVSETEAADTTVNVKFIDTTSGSYAIFAFQEQHLAEAKTIKPGDKISVKGSCSGGIFSRLRKATFISFKRCALDK